MVGVHVCQQKTCDWDVGGLERVEKFVGAAWGEAAIDQVEGF